MAIHSNAFGKANATCAPCNQQKGTMTAFQFQTKVVGQSPRCQETTKAGKNCQKSVKSKIFTSGHHFRFKCVMALLFQLETVLNAPPTPRSDELRSLTITCNKVRVGNREIFDINVPQYFYRF